MRVIGSQITRPAELEINIDTVYIRKKIERVQVSTHTGMVDAWDYDEEQLTYGEFMERENHRVSATESVAGIVFVNQAQKGEFDDTTIAEHALLFAEWQSGLMCDRGTIIMDDGDLYRALHGVIDSHTASLRPSENPNLWQKIGNPNDEWLEWSAWLGVGDTYQVGDKCSYNGKHWTSTAPNNVWRPGEYGWQEVV